MGPPEWKRCMRAAGVLNEDIATRLFDMFDASGDKEMNAKEFTWGLSDICSEDPPVGQTMTKDEVRRAFAYCLRPTQPAIAPQTPKNERLNLSLVECRGLKHTHTLASRYRFYDSNLGGFFEKDECRSFLLSWKTSSENCVRSANDIFMQVYVKQTQKSPCTRDAHNRRNEGLVLLTVRSIEFYGGRRYGLDKNDLDVIPNPQVPVLYYPRALPPTSPLFWND
jgi:hypothetical protein